MLTKHIHNIMGILVPIFVYRCKRFHTKQKSQKKLVHGEERSISNRMIMSNRLAGKVAVITGATQGIGYAIAERLAKEGASVAISSRKQENVDSAVQQLQRQGFKVIGTTCHVSNPTQRTNLFKLAESTFGGIDILIANAGVNPRLEAVLDCEESTWDKIFDVNVKASYLLAKEGVPYLKLRKGGKIIFNTSMVVYRPFEKFGAYTAAKTALIGLAKTAAVQLARENIQVNCIAPGIIRTKFAEMLTGNEEELLSITPSGRFGMPEEVAAAAAFLASHDANYITGETIVVAGGAAGRL